jgi:hypothetical protein
MALAYLRAQGWPADARGNPLNAVRTTLAHLPHPGKSNWSAAAFMASRPALQRNRDRQEALVG